MARSAYCSFLLLAMLCASSALAQENILLPTGDLSITTVDASDKNSGMSDDEEDQGLGYIRYMATAQNKGQHLSQAVSSIRTVNVTAALALQSCSALPASNQSAFTGQDLYTETLSSYIQYWGGFMMTKPHTLNVYLIYYGKWTEQQKNIIRTFINSMDRRGNDYLDEPTVVGWWAINARYYQDKLKRPTSQFVSVKKELDLGYIYSPLGSKKKPLTHDNIRLIVRRSMSKKHKNRFPVDKNGAYFVLTSADVHVTDFCEVLCAYHTSARLYGTKIAYGFVGNPASQCPIYCTYRYYNLMYQPPNGDLGADAIVDKIGHELSEIATNPLHGPDDTPGWIVAKKQLEVADLCEWDYGIPNYEPNGQVWNVKGKGGMRFLVQRLFNRRLRKCVLQADDTIQ